MASTRPAGWISSNFPGYRLEKQVVIKFLEDKFGDWEDGSYSEQDFDVKFEQDKYIFNIPRSLTTAEEEELMRLRIPDSDDE
ncbi:hypothetical protein V2W45_1409447 [Cenococcum geophilum]